MKKTISVLLISLLLAALFSAAACAEGLDPAEDAPRRNPVGWGVFSLPPELRPRNTVPTGNTDPTENLPALLNASPLPDTISSDDLSAGSRSPEEIEQEIISRCSETAPVILLTTVPVPYIPMGEIDTNYWD